jgi:pimeloyl-ACP methyl ester carboxylesterase
VSGARHGSEGALAGDLSVTARAVEIAGDGREIWARQAGSGRDVVLIAGIGDDHHVWDPIFDELAERRRVTAFDNRGVGRSVLGAEAVSIEDLADDTIALMRALGIEQADIVGSSMGGAIAQELGLREPDAVASLALVGTWGERDEHFSYSIQHIRRLLELIEDPVELFDAIALWAFSGRAFAEGTVDELRAAALASDSPDQSFEDFARTADALLAHDPGARLGGIVAPTLVVVGSEDRLCPPRLARRLAELIPGSELRVVEDRSHQLFQEVPAEFVALLEQFWVSHGR